MYCQSRLIRSNHHSENIRPPSTLLDCSNRVASCFMTSIPQADFGMMNLQFGITEHKQLSSSGFSSVLHNVNKNARQVFLLHGMLDDPPIDYNDAIARVQKQAGKNVDFNNIKKCHDTRDVENMAIVAS
jgi:hypothetical protein